MNLNASSSSRSSEVVSFAEKLDSHLQGVPFLDYHFSASSLLTVNGDGKSIVWAPNGTGKSTFCDAVAKISDDYGATLLEFEDYTSFITEYGSGKQSNVFTISAKADEYESLSEERKRILDTKSFSDCIKQQLGASNQKDYQAYFGEYFAKYGLTSPKDEKTLEQVLIHYNSEATRDLHDRLSSIDHEDKEFFLRYYPGLRKLKVDEKWRDQLCSSLIKVALESVLQIMDSDGTRCPICDSVKDEPIAEIVKKKITDLRLISDSLVNSYLDANVQLRFSKDEAMKRIRSLSELADSTDQETVLSYAMCMKYFDGDDFQKALSVCASHGKRLRKIRNRLSSLEEVRKRFFESLCRKRDSLETLYDLKFGAKLCFDEARKSLEVTLPRSFKCYSTGERNLMVFATRICAFRASQSNILIIDDPLSSYDSTNQYAVLFELVDLASSKEAKGSAIIVFTHSLKCISIAESQRRGAYRYYALDKLPDDGEGRHIVDIKEIPFRDLRDEKLYELFGSLYSAESFATGLAVMMELERVDEKVAQKFKEKLAYIEANYLRDHGCSDYSEVFHYNSPAQSVSFDLDGDGFNLSNEWLAGQVDAFVVDSLFPITESIACHWIDCIILALSIRVWVEKQLYGGISQEFQAALSTRYKLVDKIQFVFGGKNVKWKGDSSITKDYLMSYKAMLNQTEHVSSQPIPYEYTLNITSKDLAAIINDLRSHFHGNGKM